MRQKQRVLAAGAMWAASVSLGQADPAYDLSAGSLPGIISSSYLDEGQDFAVITLGNAPVSIVVDSASGAVVSSAQFGSHATAVDYFYAQLQIGNIQAASEGMSTLQSQAEADQLMFQTAVPDDSALYAASRITDIFLDATEQIQKRMPDRKNMGDVLISRTDLKDAAEEGLQACIASGEHNVKSASIMDFYNVFQESGVPMENDPTEDVIRYFLIESGTKPEDLPEKIREFKRDAASLQKQQDERLAGQERERVRQVNCSLPPHLRETSCEAIHEVIVSPFEVGAAAVFAGGTALAAGATAAVVRREALEAAAIELVEQVVPVAVEVGAEAAMEKSVQWVDKHYGQCLMSAPDFMNCF